MGKRRACGADQTRSSRPRGRSAGASRRARGRYEPPRRRFRAWSPASRGSGGKMALRVGTAPVVPRRQGSSRRARRNVKDARSPPRCVVSPSGLHRRSWEPRRDAFFLVVDGWARRAAFMLHLSRWRRVTCVCHSKCELRSPRGEAHAEGARSGAQAHSRSRKEHDPKRLLKCAFGGFSARISPQSLSRVRPLPWLH